MMSDEIVQDVHRVRARLYAETQEMTDDERRAKAHAAGLWMQQQIEECRDRYAGEIVAKLEPSHP